MLLIEKGGAARVADEFAAYRPLVSRGSELVATVLFEIEDPVRRAAALARLGGVEDHLYLQVGEEKIYGVQDGDVERTREDGKTSSVHFLHFPLTEAQKAVFRSPGVQVLVGSDHEAYAHMAVLTPATRAELARDFA